MAESARTIFKTLIPRHENVKANALTGLAASMALSENDTLKITVMEWKLLRPLDTHQVVVDCFQVSKSRTPYENSFGDWRELFINYILYSILPGNVKDRTSIQRRIPDIIMIFRLELYIEDHSMEFYYSAYPKRKPKHNERGPRRSISCSSGWTKIT